MDTAVLTALLRKYQAFLEAMGPMSVDAFLFTGEQGRGETFAIFIARQELQEQELESQIGEALSPLVAGRILIKQANLTDLQREMISLKSQVLRSFDEIANSLRSLDRLEALSKPMVPMASSAVAMQGDVFGSSLPAWGTVFELMRPLAKEFSLRSRAEAMSLSTLHHSQLETCIIQSICSA